MWDSSQPIRRTHLTWFLRWRWTYSWTLNFKSATWRCQSKYCSVCCHTQSAHETLRFFHVEATLCFPCRTFWKHQAGEKRSLISQWVTYLKHVCWGYLNKTWKSWSDFCICCTPLHCVNTEDRIYLSKSLAAASLDNMNNWSGKAFWTETHWKTCWRDFILRGHCTWFVFIHEAKYVNRLFTPKTYFFSCNRSARFI